MNTEKPLELSGKMISTGYEKPIIANISLTDVHCDNKQLHFRARSFLEGRTPEEQKEIAADMFSQMKQLQAHNEVMGYNGFSELLQRHDSDMNITGNHNNYDSDSTYSDSTTVINNIQKTRNENSQKVILSETQPLRSKLETISMCIDKMQQDLESGNAQQLNQSLTRIQEQIEDAEHAIDSHVDVTFLKYIQEIKINKEKIKNMAKQREENEKQYQINKDKEQKNIIQMQRLRIEQLIRAQSPRSTIGAVIDNDIHSSINTEDDDDMYTMQTMAMQYSPISPISPITPISPIGYGLSEGLQRQQPLLSDNAIKIIGGFAIMLSGIWTISKYIDGGGRGPRFKY